MNHVNPPKETVQPGTVIEVYGTNSPRGGIAPLEGWHRVTVLFALDDDVYMRFNKAEFICVELDKVHWRLPVLKDGEESSSNNNSDSVEAFELFDEDKIVIKRKTS